MKTKKELRKEILKLRDALPLKDRQIKSHQIADQIVSRKEFVEADKILLFASYKSEVDTSEIFKAARMHSKDIYYPRVLGKEMEFYQVKEMEDLVEGYRGIREPEISSQKRFSPKSKDNILILMPGAVFDEEGNRIGYGGGYYDRFLHQLGADLRKETAMIEEHICKIAVAFECQMIEIGKIEKESHDIKPDYIVTENKIIHIWNV